MKPAMVCCIFLFGPFTAHGDEPLTQHEQAAKNFTFENVKLGTTLKDFLKGHPNVKNLTEAEHKRVGVVVLSGSTNYGAVAGFRFLDDKLYEVRVLYDEKCLDRMGGIGTLATKIAGIIGKATQDKVQKGKMIQYVWEFPNVDRFFAFVQDDVDVEYAKFYIQDSKLEAIFRDRLSKNAKTGLGGK